jgi:asparagine synthase (glutamine-hydrolysing)
MVSDVPLGAFLSGGVDSSTVVAHMQSLASQPVRTFTIGTAHTGYNEADHAAAVAKHLGTDHTELYVAPEDALGVVGELPRIYDEPFADSSQIPTVLVSRLARRHVTVGLSGDGGDEVFVGYNRYLLADRLRRIASAVPDGALRFANRMCRNLSADQWANLLNKVRWGLPERFRNTVADDRLITLACMLASEWPWGVYEALVSHWREESPIVLGVTGISHTSSVDSKPAGSRSWGSLVRDMVLEDQRSYLPDDILVKVDRASMSASLEARAPLLDHRIIEFMAALPMEMSLRDRIGKRLLRKSLYKHVPQSLIDRPKSGFGIPIGHWLRNELRGWAEELLSPARLASQGILNPQPVQLAWQAHLSGQRQEHHRLWSVLMFQLWLEDARVGSSAASTAVAYG